MRGLDWAADRRLNCAVRGARRRRTCLSRRWRESNSANMTYWWSWTPTSRMPRNPSPTFSPPCISAVIRPSAAATRRRSHGPWLEPETGSQLAARESAGTPQMRSGTYPLQADSSASVRLEPASCGRRPVDDRPLSRNTATGARGRDCDSSLPAKPTSTVLSASTNRLFHGTASPRCLYPFDSRLRREQEAGRP